MISDFARKLYGLCHRHQSYEIGSPEHLMAYLEGYIESRKGIDPKLYDVGSLEDYKKELEELRARFRPAKR